MEREQKLEMRRKNSTIVEDTQTPSSYSKIFRLAGFKLKIKTSQRSLKVKKGHNYVKNFPFNNINLISL